MWGDGSHYRGVSKAGRVMAKEETSKVEPGLSFHEAVGMNMVGQEVKAFENALFSQNIGVMDSNSVGGSWITKINGCLERCKERPKLVIPFEMIAEDVEYYSKHSLYCKFLSNFWRIGLEKCGNQRVKWRLPC